MPIESCVSPRKVEIGSGEARLEVWTLEPNCKAKASYRRRREMSLRNRFGVFCFALTFVTAYTYAFAAVCPPPLPTVCPAPTKAICQPPPGAAPVADICQPPHDKHPGVESFSMVHLVDLSAIKSTIVPHLSDCASEAIFAQGANICDRIHYDHKTHKFTNELFLVCGNVEETEAFAFIDVHINEVDTLCRSDPD